MWGLGIMLLSRFKGGGVLVKYAAIALAIVGAVWYIHHKGVISERAKWERAALVEQGRQTEINTRWVTKSVEDALALDALNTDLDNLREELNAESIKEPTAGNECITPAGSLRLNRVR